MSAIRLILEHAPTPQAATEMTYHGGQMVVGRGDDADWCIDDPDKYISRKHFVVSTDGARVVVTDASTGGLFIDGATTPLGVGNSITVEHGMRLRFGDFVAKVDANQTTETGAQPIGLTTPEPSSSPFDFNFGPSADASAEPTPRPESLPTPFGAREEPVLRWQADDTKNGPKPLDLDDPFALDAPAIGARASKPDRSHGAYFGAFDEGNEYTPTAATHARPRVPIGGDNNFFEPRDPPAPPPAPDSAPGPGADAPHPATPPFANDAALRKAFFKGLGIAPTDLPPDAEAEEMEALGRRFRALADGLAHMMKTRASEKQMARVARTIIGSSNVNPLKHVVGPDEAVEVLVRAKSKNYLDPDATIASSQKDLIDHQVRIWTALQRALRKMIEKFDPEEIEREMDDTGLLEAIMAGGRSGKLWQLYQDRYNEIANAAEERFLGEIGSDFRDAYEDRNRE